MKTIKAYEAVDVYGKNRRYRITSEIDVVQKDTVDARFVDVTQDYYREISRFDPDEVRDFVQDILSK